MELFIEYLNELESSVAFLTETWLTDSDHLDSDIEDLESRTNYSLICKNRGANARGYSTGGVAIAFKKSHIISRKLILRETFIKLFLQSEQCLGLAGSLFPCVSTCLRLCPLLLLLAALSSLLTGFLK